MRRLGLAVVIGLAAATSAQAAPRGNYVVLPSPLAQLSQSPPLGGGATATAEALRHRVDAKTKVEVALGPDGRPFAVHATQRLDVRVLGDYFFTIGAPVLDVEAAPGSDSTPGLRATSILWTGFNPGRRTLIARTTLEPSATIPSLPLRIEVAPGRVTLVNTTAIVAGSFTAEATGSPLARYLRQLGGQLERGETPTSGGAYVTSRPTPVQQRVVAPLLVTGTVGGREVDAIVEGRLVVRADGPVRLTVTPASPGRLLYAPTTGLSGRELLTRANQAALTIARMRQYETFLGNPDPTGRSHTIYTYRSASRPTPPPVATVAPSERNWASTIAVAAGLLLAAAGAGVAWSRS